MGKQKKVSKKSKAPLKDPQEHPISKSETLIANLNSFMKMLKRDFASMPAKSYIKQIHQYIDKINRKLKFTDQNRIVAARRKIKICCECEEWSSNKKFIECSNCGDFYHHDCVAEQGQSIDGGDWQCEECQSYYTNDQIHKSGAKMNRNSYLRRMQKEEECKKCKKPKQNEHDAFVICMKCEYRFHRQCYGKGCTAVCQKCHNIISDEIKEKQASLFDYKFEKSTQKKERSSQGEFKVFGKNVFGNQNGQTPSSKKSIRTEEQETQATLSETSFTKNFPAMTQSEVEQYKNGLFYAIRAKEMTHSEELMPDGGFSIYEDNEESLDFGLGLMNREEYAAYKKYKSQPFGPFKFVYKQDMGYDVICDKDLPKGMLVCEYVGDVVSYRQVIFEFSRTGVHNDSLFELRAGRNSNETLYIRPKKYSNMARFINGVNNQTGMGKINVESVRRLVDGKPGIFLYTTRPIRKGESLAYDYNAGGLGAYPTEDFV